VADSKLKRLIDMCFEARTLALRIHSHKDTTPERKEHLAARVEHRKARRSQALLACLQSDYVDVLLPEWLLVLAGVDLLGAEDG
jgi:hypothetical protein